MNTWASFTQARAVDPVGVDAVLRAGDAVGASRRGLAWAVVNESGWRPDAQGPDGHNGLLQFSKSFAPNAYTLSREEQAPLVKRYLAPWKKYFTGRVSDVYLAIAYPQALKEGWDDDAIVDSFEDVWKKNPAWRTSPNGPITVGSIRAFGGEPPPGGPDETGPLTPPSPVASSPSSGGGIAAAIGFALFTVALIVIKVRRG